MSGMLLHKIRPGRKHLLHGRHHLSHFDLGLRIGSQGIKIVLPQIEGILGQLAHIGVDIGFLDRHAKHLSTTLSFGQLTY